MDRWLINGKEFVPNYHFFDHITPTKIYREPLKISLTGFSSQFLEIPYISFEVRKEHILNENGKNIIKVNVEMRKGKRIKLIYDSSKITCHDIEENSVESGDAVLERTSLYFNAKEGIEVAKWLLNGKIKDGGKSNSFHSYMKLEDAEENEREKVITISIEEK